MEGVAVKLEDRDSQKLTHAHTVILYCICRSSPISKKTVEPVFLPAMGLRGFARAPPLYDIV